MTLIAWTLILGLAAFRLWRLAAVDSITEPLHGRILAMKSPAGQWFSSMWHCPWCLGFHLSIVVWALWTYLPAIGQPICMILAISTLVGFIGKLDDR